MSQITSHILDIARGTPAGNVVVSLHRQEQRQEQQRWHEVGQGRTNSDGRITDLCSKADVLPGGTYRMHFETAAYFERNGDPVFYPWVDVVFCIDGDGQHYHIPLLLSPFGHSTYRGS